MTAKQAGGQATNGWPVETFSLPGIDALPVEVEVDTSPSGLAKNILVGLPEAAVKESTHRVERALVNSGFLRPESRTVSILPRLTWLAS